MSTSETPATAAACGKAAGPAHIVVQHGEVRDTPLNRLKASPKNVRRVGHSAEVIESRAASITHKGVLQPLVVEPEVKNGQETGYYLVSAGKGRRQALRLLAKRKALTKGAAVRCVVSLAASTRVNSDCRPRRMPRGGEPVRPKIRPVSGDTGRTPLLALCRPSHPWPGDSSVLDSRAPPSRSVGCSGSSPAIGPPSSGGAIAAWGSKPSVKQSAPVTPPTHLIALEHAAKTG